MPKAVWLATRLAWWPSVSNCGWNNMEIHQIDIKGAYLNGKLNSDEQIYMAQPPGYHAPNSVGLVCRLIKTLYGLKQSRQHWYQQLVEIMESLKFERSDMDQAVFYRKTGSHPMVMLMIAPLLLLRHHSFMLSRLRYLAMSKSQT